MTKLVHDLVHISEWTQDIRPHVTKCPTPVIEHHVRRAIIEACERARIWRDNIPEIPVCIGKTLYELHPPTPESRIHSILSVCLGGRAIRDSSEDHVNRTTSQHFYGTYVYDTAGIAGYHIPDRGFIELLREPIHNSRFLGTLPVTSPATAEPGPEPEPNRPEPIVIPGGQPGGEIVNRLWEIIPDRVVLVRGRSGPLINTTPDRVEWRIGDNEWVGSFEEVFGFAVGQNILRPEFMPVQLRHVPTGEVVDIEFTLWNNGGGGDLPPSGNPGGYEAVATRNHIFDGGSGPSTGGNFLNLPEQQMSSIYDAQVGLPDVSGFFMRITENRGFPSGSSDNEFIEGNFYWIEAGSSLSPNSVAGEASGGPLFTRFPNDPAVIGRRWYDTNLNTDRPLEYVIDPIPLLDLDGNQFTNSQVNDESPSYWIYNGDSLQRANPPNPADEPAPTPEPPAPAPAMEIPVDLTGYRDVPGIEVTASIKPERNALEVARVIHEDYYELIRSGALSFLTMIPNQPWSNPEMAQYYKREFEIELNRSRQMIDRGFTTKSQRIKPRKFY